MIEFVHVRVFKRMSSVFVSYMLFVIKTHKFLLLWHQHTIQNVSQFSCDCTTQIIKTTAVGHKNQHENKKQKQ